MLYVVLAALLGVAGCVGDAPPDDGADDDAPATTLACDHAEYAQPVVDVVVATSEGDFRIQLAGDRSPITVCNFLRYVDEDFYDGTIFHRICEGFVIQAGGVEAGDAPGQSQERPAHEPIENEAQASGLNNTERTIAMARNAEPDSATSHFFINLKENSHLDPGGVDEHGYAVFGSVTEGWDNVQTISQATVRPDPTSGCPGENWVWGFEVTIDDVRLEA